MSTEIKRPPVGILVTCLALTAAALAMFVLVDIVDFGLQQWWVWPVTIIGFAAADATVVRVHFRSETTAFTFVELPLFLAAIYIAPLVVWLSMTVGVALSVFALQRLSPMKAAFNIANLSLQGAVGLWVFHTVLNGADPIGPFGWLAAAVAAVISSAVAAAGIVFVLMLVQPRSALHGVEQTVFMSAITGMTNVSLALVAAVLINYRPLALVLLTLPTGVLFGAYRAYIAERTHRDRVQAMHELALEVRSIRDQAGVVPVLQLAADHLGALRSELVLFADHRDGGNGMRFTTDGNEATISEVLSSELALTVDAVLGTATPQVRLDGDRNQAEIVGVVRGEGRALGMLTLSGRVHDASNLGSDDIVMFETIVVQLGLTLEKNRLGNAVSQLERHSRELQHEAQHDVLTGVGNRALLAARLEEELARHGHPTLLYIDLDEFKNVNDQYGHDAGDEVLIEIARRFAAVIGPSDCVVRLGGDEFAVLLSEHSNDVAIANAVLAAASAPIEVSGGTVHLKASLGLARSRRSGDVATLLKRADVAMYEAKANGKGKMTLAASVIQL